MKNLLLSFVFLFSTISLFSQEIQEIQAYSKLGGTRIVSLLEDQSKWFYIKDEGWRSLPVGEFPKGKVKFLDVYHKLTETRLMIVMDDNSLWWNKDEKWVKVPNGGLPNGYSIKALF